MVEDMDDPELIGVTRTLSYQFIYLGEAFTIELENPGGRGPERWSLGHGALAWTTYPSSQQAEAAARHLTGTIQDMRRLENERNMLGVRLREIAESHGGKQK